MTGCVFFFFSKFLFFFYKDQWYDQLIWPLHIFWSVFWKYFASEKKKVSVVPYANALGSYCWLGLHKSLWATSDASVNHPCSVDSKARLWMQTIGKKPTRLVRPRRAWPVFSSPPTLLGHLLTDYSPVCYNINYTVSAALAGYSWGGANCKFCMHMIVSAYMMAAKFFFFFFFCRLYLVPAFYCSWHGFGWGLVHVACYIFLQIPQAPHRIISKGDGWLVKRAIHPQNPCFWEGFDCWQ